MIMCYRLEVTLRSRHMGEQEKTHKPTHMAQAQGGLLEIQTRARFESGVMKVTYSQHVSIILVAQSHVISQKKKKILQQE